VQDVRLFPGVPTAVEIAVCARGRWQLTFVADSRGFVGNRVVSARATEPLFVPGTCRSRRGTPTTV
jgi:hypothetical protein